MLKTPIPLGSGGSIQTQNRIVHVKIVSYKKLGNGCFVDKRHDLFHKQFQGRKRSEER